MCMGLQETSEITSVDLVRRNRMQSISLYGVFYSYKLFRNMKGDRHREGDRAREGERERGTENIPM